MRTLAVFASLALIALSACAGHLATRPGVYQVRDERIPLADHGLPLTLVEPSVPRSPVSLILFASGDAGWLGTSGAILEHMAERGYYVAAYDSREIVKPLKHSSKLLDIPAAAAAVDSILVQSRRALGLADTTPVIVAGFSRGANFVVFTAGVESLQHHVKGALAVALTREADYLRAPEHAKRSSTVKVDEEGRLQMYPAIARAGPIPFAVIQSTGDKYVPAGESRTLFGPDTPTRRLYEVQARNHGFSGGQEELARDLDDALLWIESTWEPPRR